MAVALLRLSAPVDIPPIILILSLVVLLLVLCLLRGVFYPTLDPREPPLLRPKVPFIGHSLSIVTKGGGYYDRLYKSTKLPICTLPVLADRVYVINSTALIAAALRCPTLSFDPFIVLFSKNALGASTADLERLRDRDYIDSAKKPFYPSMSGDPLRLMVGAALADIARGLNGLGVGGGGGGGVCEIPHVGEWLREVISRAVMVTLYGDRNPITLDRLYDIWEFDRKITVLTLGLAPRLLAPKAVAGRDRIQAALYEYYREGHYQAPDVSAFVRNRAAAKRQMGVRPIDLASGETDIPWTALTNTIPSLAWVFVSVFARPEFAERVRQETAEATSMDGDKASVDMEKLGRQPFISAVVQEVQRMYNKLCGYRQVLEDTVLRDVDGREYFLKKGSNAQWFHGVPHLSEDIWGPDAKAFNPERFIDAPAEEEKRRRGAFIPFGGGKHLCPGRRFAVTEIIGMVGAIALVFDVDDISVPPAKAGYAGCAMAHPDWKPSNPPRVKFRRREGWENVQLEFIV
ncbi:cytochrome P450 [Chaetomium sp. MPI-CAGE-AT-0009]|nr:cytochrome P450 [Chaetomium sp. MPI-CAGE-AT-0009]